MLYSLCKINLLGFTFCLLFLCFSGITAGPTITVTTPTAKQNIPNSSTGSFVLTIINQGGNDPENVNFVSITSEQDWEYRIYDDTGTLLIATESNQATAGYEQVEATRDTSPTDNIPEQLNVPQGSGFNIEIRVFVPATPPAGLTDRAIITVQLPVTGDSATIEIATTVEGTLTCYPEPLPAGNNKPDLPGFVPYNVVLEKGSLIIPMDNTLQKVTATGLFNLKAYGLVARLLDANILLYWIIKSPKLKEGVDFTAKVSQVKPSPGPTQLLSFKAGPFAIVRQQAAAATTLYDSLDARFIELAIYQLEQDVEVPMRYEMTTKVRAALSTAGPHEQTHRDQFALGGLDAALDHYEELSLTEILNLSPTACYTCLTEPHYDDLTGAYATSVKPYVRNGGNMIAQCAAAQMMERSLYLTTNGIIQSNNDNNVTYVHNDIPYMQFEGAHDFTKSGTLRDFILETGPPASSFSTNAYGTSYTDPGFQYATAIGKLNDAGAQPSRGSIVFYLGGHVYDDSNYMQTNGVRLFLNAVITPANRPASCAFDVKIDITTFISVSPASVSEGDTLTYTVEVRNLRTISANDVEMVVVLENPLVSHITTNTPAPGSSSVTGCCTITISAGVLAGGDSYFATIQAFAEQAGNPAATSDVSSSSPELCAAKTNNFATVSSTIIVEPDIAVFGSSKELADAQTAISVDDLTDFQEITLLQGPGHTRTHTFQITNTRFSTLNLNSISSNSGNFVVNNLPVLSTLERNEWISFDVTFVTGGSPALGQKSGTITIRSSDPDEDPFTFAVRGFVVDPTALPNIEVLGNGYVISNGDTTPQTLDNTKFGDTTVAGSAITKEFTIRNFGTAPLLIEDVIRITGAGSGHFTVSVPPGTPIPSGGTTTFSIVYDPSATGTHDATVSIDSSDTSKDPYTFSITGTAVTGPEIQVEGNSLQIENGDTIPSYADHTKYIDGNIGTLVSRTFVVKNIGTSDLTINTITSSASEFVLVSPPTGTVTPGNQVNLQVDFTPVRTGIKQSTITIGNTDADEGTYTFVIEGAGVAVAPTDPDIEVFGNGQRIQLADVTPSTIDDTYFGVLAIGATDSHRFTVTNNGNAVLNINSITMKGANGAEFVVSAISTSAIATGNSATFDVSFTAGTTPLSVGRKTAIVEIASDDPDENPFVYTVAVDVVAPEIQVLGNNVDIVTGDTTPSLADHTDFGEIIFPSTGGGDQLVRTFAIKNIGASDLSLGAITNGGNAHFVIANQVNGILKPNQVALFDVRFTPSAAVVGTVSSTILSIANNDPDEAPFTYTVAATVVSGSGNPDIAVLGNSIIIPHQSTTTSEADDTNYGNVGVGNAKDHTFTIINQGSADLILNPPITITGVNAGDFTIQQQPPKNILFNTDSTTFVVRFLPTAAGTRTARVEIPSSDPNENPFVFTIAGTGISGVPEMDVEGNGVPIQDGDSTPTVIDFTDFGDVFVSDTKTRQFVILNRGTNSLALNGTPRVSSSNSVFAVSAQPAAASVAANSQLTFDVTFDPVTAGQQVSIISIPNNDPDEAPYNFIVRANALAATAVDITVLGNNVEIHNGDNTPSLVDHTKFAPLTAGTATRTFTIRNNGGSALVLNGGTPVEIVGSQVSSGPGNAGFRITTSPASTNLANHNDETTFIVTYEAADAQEGVQRALVKINSNDPDENPFYFSLEAYVVIERLDLTSPSINAVWYMYYSHCIVWIHNFAATHELELELMREADNSKVNSFGTFRGPAGRFGNQYCWKPHKMLPIRVYVKPVSFGPTHNNKQWVNSPVFKVNVKPMENCNNVPWGCRTQT